jgi:hypothetical protein
MSCFNFTFGFNFNNLPWGKKIDITNHVHQNVIKQGDALSLLLSDFDPEYVIRNTQRKSVVIKIEYNISASGL